MTKSLRVAGMRSNQLPPWLAVGFLCLMTVALFAPALRFGFVGWDDNTHLLENPYLQPPLSLEAIRYFWLKPYFLMYIPVTYSVWAAVVKATATAGSALSPLAFHALNVCLHACNAIIVWFIIRRFKVAVLPALCGALIFAMHPVQVEAVVWISALKDVLSAFFALLGIGLWLGVVSAVKSSHADKRLVPLRLGLVACCFVLAILAKPSAVVAPVLACVLGFALQSEANAALRQRLFLLLPAMLGVLLAALAVLITVQVQPLPVDLKPAPWWARPLLAGDALSFWLAKIFIPLDLAPDYGRTPELAMQARAIAIIWLIPVGISVVLWRLRQRWPLLAVGWWVFLLGCLPNWGLVAFAFQNVSTVADRYLYLAMLGVALALAAVAQHWRPHIVLLVVVCAVISLATLTRVQMRHWQSTESLFAFMLERNPQSFTAAHGLAYAAHQSGDLAKAIPLYEQALRANPQFADAYTNLGTALYQKGEAAAAVSNFQKSLALAPDDGITYGNLGLALEKLGRADEAMKNYLTAIQRSNSPYAAFYLGNLLAEQADMAGAIRAYQLAVRVMPRMTRAWERLGFLLLNSEDLIQAEAAFRQALSIEPQAAKAWLGLARSLQRQARSSEAQQAFARAVALDAALGQMSLDISTTGQSPLPAISQ